MWREESIQAAEGMSTDCPGRECDTNRTAERPVWPQHVAKKWYGVSRG